MTGASRPPSQRNYPITPAPENDPRFTFGLLVDVNRALEQHGYGALTGCDLVDLQQALFRFLYGSSATGERQ